MKGTDIIRSALAFTDRFGMKMLEDMRDACTTYPTPNGGNHPLWIVGHLAVTEGELYGMVTGEPNPVEQWNVHFAPGTAPSENVEDYPPYDELLDTLQKLRSRTLKLLDELSDDDLSRAPKRNFPGGEDIFGTVGQVLTAIAMHQEFHLGQIADARRAAGRKPMFEMDTTSTT